jgi:hypothetical protein
MWLRIDYYMTHGGSVSIVTRLLAARTGFDYRQELGILLSTTFGSGQRQVSGSSEHDNEPSSSIKGIELVIISFSRRIKTLLHVFN